MASAELNSLLQRHAAFWDSGAHVLLEQVDRYQPLAVYGGERGLPLAGGARSRDGELLAPELIEPRRFWEGAPQPTDAVRGDFITGLTPPHLCWTEAVVGCPVRIVRGGPWAEPFARDWRRPTEVVGAAGWLDKLGEFARLLAERAAGHCPVIQPLMRGPIDMMASAMGHEQACLALVEEPAAAGAFLARCAELFIEAAECMAAPTPQFAGGYVSAYGIWAPGTVVRTQADNATMLSPETYRQQVLPHDRAVMRRFDYPLIHLHSGCLHIADALLEVPELRAIQVSMDHPGGPLAAQVMPILERMAVRKPLIVTGPVTAAELEALRSLARLGSVCLQVQVCTDRDIV